MPWVVTLKSTRCDNGSLLPGAFITDGVVTYYTDSNAQFVLVISDAYTDYGVNVGKSGFHTKLFAMNRAAHAGSIQTVCLNEKIPPTDGGGGGGGGGW